MRQQAAFNKYNMPPGAGILGMPSGKPILTKKTAMDPKAYINICFKNAIKKYWWAFLVPPAIIAPGFYFTGALIWLAATAILLTVLYLLFWYVQFYGMTMLPQGKPLFEKQLFAITKDGIGLMTSERDMQARMLPWDAIKAVDKEANQYVLHLTLAHIVIMPFDIFNSAQDQNFLEALLRKRNLLPAKA